MEEKESNTLPPEKPFSDFNPPEKKGIKMKCDKIKEQQQRAAHRSQQLSLQDLLRDLLYCNNQGPPVAPSTWRLLNARMLCFFTKTSTWFYCFILLDLLLVLFSPLDALEKSISQMTLWYIFSFRSIQSLEDHP